MVVQEALGIHSNPTAVAVVVVVRGNLVQLAHEELVALLVAVLVQVRLKVL